MVQPNVALPLGHEKDRRAARAHIGPDAGRVPDGREGGTVKLRGIVDIVGIVGPHQEQGAVAMIVIYCIIGSVVVASKDVEAGSRTHVSVGLLKVQALALSHYSGRFRWRRVKGQHHGGVTTCSSTNVTSSVVVVVVVVLMVDIPLHRRTPVARPGPDLDQR